LFGKKKAKLFGNGIEPDCAYCVYASEEDCAAGGKGQPCERFRYDPLKRTPGTFPALKQHNPEEFKL
jgi:hypothetical protein